MSLYPLIRPLIFTLPAETAHKAAIGALKRGWVPAEPLYNPEPLKTKCFGLSFANPIGLAAGFDKNAEAAKGLQKQGFGFLELGTVTPQPQAGNKKPRIFRLTKDKAVINRLGFNNDGLEVYCDNLRFKPCNQLPFGANLGKNKHSGSAIADYLQGLQEVYTYADYVTINISSPNTAGLRDLQEKEQLEALLRALMTQRNELADMYERKVPLLLKIAPDLEKGEPREAIAEVALEHKIDGLIVSNTTISRPDSLKSGNKTRDGGLSGKPLMKPSTAILRDMYQLTHGELPLIGVGGVASADDAYQKIRAGASLVQVYSALVYQGFSLVTDIKKGLVKRLKADGFKHISEAIGVDAKK